MQRPATTVAIGALSVAVVVLLVLRGKQERPIAPPQPAILVSAPVPSSAPLAFSRSLPPLALPAPPSSRPLPPGTPKTVRFGVVLFHYRGAQGARDDARSRDEALVLARTAGELARRDFKAAVKSGDAGSAEDAGRIARGILEPGVELELFTLGVGAVSEPIDTPRGYWVAKRLE